MGLAFAELDDLLTLCICNLAEINESRAVVLLGRTAISRKLEMAGYLANLYGPWITKLQNDTFKNEAFTNCLKCRNTVAHGSLL